MSNDAEPLGKTGMIDLETTTAQEFLQMVYGMLEGMKDIDGIGTEIQFTDMDGIVKSMWLERWEDV